MPVCYKKNAQFVLNVATALQGVKVPSAGLDEKGNQFYVL